MEKARERITKKITICQLTGCWIWNGNPRENGYCRTTFENKSWYIHRLSYLAFVGEIPKNMDVCHSCDNRSCCNPLHLFAGTRKENMEDCLKKGRQAKGPKLPQCKLSDEQKKEIIQRALDGEFYKKIAKDFGITVGHAGYIAINFGNVRRNNVVSK